MQAAIIIVFLAGGIATVGLIWWMTEGKRGGWQK